MDEVLDLLNPAERSGCNRRKIHKGNENIRRACSILAGDGIPLY